MRLLKLLNVWPPFTKAGRKKFPGQKSIEVVGVSSASLSDPGYSGKTIEEVGAASAETRKP